MSSDSQDADLLADETLLALYSTFQNTANLHEHEARAIDQWSEVVKLEGILLGLRAVAAAAWDEGFNAGFDTELVRAAINPGAPDLRVNPYNA